MSRRLSHPSNYRDLSGFEVGVGMSEIDVLRKNAHGSLRSFQAESCLYTDSIDTLCVDSRGESLPYQLDGSALAYHGLDG